MPPVLSPAILGPPEREPMHLLLRLRCRRKNPAPTYPSGLTAVVDHQSPAQPAICQSRRDGRGGVGGGARPEITERPECQGPERAGAEPSGYLGRHHRAEKARIGASSM